LGEGIERRKGGCFLVVEGEGLLELEEICLERARLPEGRRKGEEEDVELSPPLSLPPALRHLLSLFQPKIKHSSHTHWCSSHSPSSPRTPQTLIHPTLNEISTHEPDSSSSFFLKTAPLQRRGSPQRSLQLRLPHPF